MNSPETAPDNNSAHGSTVTPQQTVYEWIKPEHLPPVACPLVLNIQGATVRGQRISHLSSRAGQMDYRLATGEVVSGRFMWSYP